MKIGVNARFLMEEERGTGIGQYTLNLIRSLAEIDSENRYTLFLVEDPPRDLKLGGNFEARRTQNPFGRSMGRLSRYLEKITWEQINLLISARRGKFDIFHLLYAAGPCVPLAQKTIVTVYDTIRFIFPEYTRSPFMGAYYKICDRAIRRADRIITPSQNSRRDIEKFFGVPPEKIAVIPIGANPIYQPVSDGRRIDRVKEKYGIEGDYILYAGGLVPHKNVSALIDAFSIVRRDAGKHHLIIVGNLKKRGVEKLTRKVDALGLGESVRLTGFADECDMPALYSGATVFAYPSLYEGFGLAPLEAMSCGAPVAVSNSSSIPEVVGEAGVYFDPRNPSDIAEKILKLLSDGELREEMRRRGLERAREFDWLKTARETLSVYEELLS
ncbi:MAG: glycosyltransferase family 4 protein [bacterium]